MRRALRFWDRLLSLVGWRPLNRRLRRRAVARRRAVGGLARRRSVIRRQRFDTLEKRVVMNAAPIAYNDSTASTSEDTAVTSTVYATDFDSDPLTYTTVTGPAHGTLTWNSGNSYTYTPDANFNGTDSFTFKANDGTVDSNSATETISVGAVNDAPSWTLAQSTYNATEQVPLELTGSGIVLNDVDAGSGNLQVDFGGDNFSRAVVVGTTGVTATTPFGAGSTIRLSGTLAQLNDFFAGSGGASMTYTPIANAPATSTVLLLRASDNGNSGGPSNNGIDANLTINITAVNDAPTAAITPASYTIAEQTSLKLKGTGLAIADVDSPSGALSMQATVSVVSGTLTATAGNSGATVSGSGTNTVTISGTKNQITTFLSIVGTSTLFYIYNGNAPPTTDTLTLTASDLGNIGTGGTLTAFDTAVINITAVNDAPTLAANAGLIATRNVGTAIGASRLNVTDPDNTASQVTFTVTAIPAHGAIKLSGVTLNVNGTFTQADINSGNLSYVNDGASLTDDSFTFTVSDGAGGSIGSTNFAIDVVNGVPTIAANIELTVNVGDGGVVAAANLAVSDVDNSASQIVFTIVDEPANGTLKLSGVALAATDTFTQADLNNGLVTYEHDSSATSEDSFTFTVADGDGGTIGVTEFSIAVNALPVALSRDYFTNAETATLSVARLLANSSDSDDDELEFDSVVATTAEGGTATYNPLTGMIDYVAPEEFTGTDTITYRLSDGRGGFSDGTLTVNVNEGYTPTYDITQTSIDPNGHSIHVIFEGSRYFGSIYDDNSLSFSYSRGSGTGSTTWSDWKGEITDTNDSFDVTITDEIGAYYEFTVLLGIFAYGGSMLFEGEGVSGQDLFFNSPLRATVNSSLVINGDLDANYFLELGDVTHPMDGELVIDGGSVTYYADSPDVASDAFTVNYTSSKVANLTYGVSGNYVYMSYGRVEQQAEKDSDDECSCDCCKNGESKVSEATGAANVKVDAVGGQRLVYSSVGEADAIIHAVTSLPPSIPETFAARVKIGDDEAGDPVYYDKSAFTGAFADLGLTTSMTGKASGIYDWSVEIFDPTDPETVIRTITGQKEFVNTTQNGLSSGWSVNGVDRLILPNEDAGTSEDVLLLKASGAWTKFNYETSGTYTSLPGFGTLAGISGGYRLTAEDGSYAEFDEDGLMTSRVDINGNVTEYHYTSGLLTEIVSATGRTTTFHYTSGVLTSIEDADGRVSELSYDVSDRLSSISQPDPDDAGALTAPVTSFTYDGFRLATLTDPDGGERSYAFDETGRVSSLTDEEGLTRSWQAADKYATVGTGTGTAINPATPVAFRQERTGQTTDAQGHVTQFTLNEMGQRTSETDELGVVTYYRWYSTGQLAERTEVGQGPYGENLVTLYDYEGSNLTRILYHDGHEELWTYVPDTDRVSSYQVRDASYQTLTYTVYHYDSAGNKIKETQVLGDVDDLDNDGLPDGAEHDDQITTYEYLTAANGLPAGLLETVTAWAEDSADNVVTSYEYYDSTNNDSNEAWIGLVKSVATGTATFYSTVKYGYDAYGRLTRETQVVNDDDEALGVTENDDRITLYEYDELDRETKVTRVAGLGIDAELNADLDGGNDEHDDAVTLTSYRYDSEGHKVISRTEVVGEADDPDVFNDATTNIVDDQLTLTTYDGAGRVIKTVQVVGHVDSIVNYDLDEENDEDDDVVMSYVYTDGDLTSTTDALGRTTTYDYDENHQLIRRTDPDPDGVGDLAAPITEYRYDEVGRVTDVIQVQGVVDDDPERPIDDPDDFVQHTEYDAAGRVTSTTDALGRLTTYEYDTLGRQIRIVGQEGHVTEFTYDARGNLIDQSQKVVDGLTTVVVSRTHYVYDMLGQQTQTIAVQGELDLESSETDDVVSTTEYDRLGRMSAQIDPLGRRTEYRYDGLGNVTHVVTIVDPEETDFDTPVLNLVTRYEYDNAGQLLKVTEPDPDGPTVGSTNLGVSPVTDYQYDRLGRQILTRRVVDTADSLSSPVDDIVTETTFDNLGRIVSLVDPRGGVTTYAYDTLGRQTSTTLPDPDGVGSQTSPVMSRTYDKLGNVVSSLDARGLETVYEYDALNRPVKVSQPHDPEALSFEWASQTVYDDAGRMAATIVSTAAELDRITKFTYDAAGRVTAITYIDGDEDGPSGPVGADPADATVTYEYDDLDRILETNDPIQGSIQRVYDDAARTVTDKVAEWVDSTVVWTVVGITSYDELGRVVTVVKPATENSDEETVSDGSTTTYTYAADGQLLSQVVTDDEDEALLRTDYIYDEHTGRQTHVIQVLGERDDEINLETDDLETETVYDNLGRVVQQIDPLGHGKSYLYDSAGRVVAQLDALAGETDFYYDQAGNRTDLVDPVGNNTHWVYDGLNRVTSEVKQTGYLGTNLATTTFVYDSAGNLVKKSTPASSIYVDYVYDDFGRLTHEYWGLTGSTPVALGGSTTSASRTIVNEYDAAGRLLAASDWAGLPPSVLNANGYTDALSAYEYEYDRFDREITSVFHYSGQPDVVLSKTYDERSRRESLAAQIGTDADFTRNYEYDAFGRLARLSQAGVAGSTGQNAVSALWAEFGYNGLGQAATMNRGTSTDPVIATSYEYDAAARLESLTHRLGTGESASGAPDDIVAGYTYTYDAAGRITGIVNAVHSSENADFSYDDTDQLTGADLAGTSDDESYEYDANGNRIAGGYDVGDHNTLTVNGEARYYTYDASGRRTSRLTTQMVHLSFGGSTAFVLSVRNGSSQGYAYLSSSLDSSNALEDALESMFAVGGISVYRVVAGGVEGEYDISWDGGVLSGSDLFIDSTTDGSPVLTFVRERSSDTYGWDERGRLVFVSHYDASGSTIEYPVATLIWTVQYSYDVYDRMIARTVVYADPYAVLTAYESTEFIYDGDQIVLERSMVDASLTRYLWGPQVDQILATDAVNSGGSLAGVQWTLTDHLNTVRDIATSGGSISGGHITYDSFGTPSSTVGRFLYTGRYFDVMTGLQNNWHRWYDASVGKWISEDPIGFDAGDTNLSRYVGNHPWDGTDPTGLQERYLPRPQPHVLEIGGRYRSKLSISNASDRVVPQTEVDFIRKAFADAGEKLGKAHHLLALYDCEVAQFYKDSGSSTGVRLKTAEGRKLYKDRTSKVFDYLENPKITTRVVTLVAPDQGQRDRGTEAFVPYGWWSGKKSEDVIYILPLFFTGLSPSGKIVHELARLLLDISGENGDGDNDPYLWRELVDNLVRNSDLIMKLRKDGTTCSGAKP